MEHLWKTCGTLMNLWKTWKNGSPDIDIVVKHGKNQGNFGICSWVNQVIMNVILIAVLNYLPEGKWMGVIEGNAYVHHEANVLST